MFIKTLHNNNIHNDEIDLKEVFRTILRYKISIVLITLVFLLGSSIFAYYKPNIYDAHASIRIVEDDNGRVGSADFMLKAFGGSTINIDNEIALINSRSIMQKALESLDLTTEYFSYNKLHKKIEFYKDSPFIVATKIVENTVYGKKFIVKPIDDEKFHLIIEPASKYSLKSVLVSLGFQTLTEQEKIFYKGVHSYNKEISTAWFTLTINKLEKLENEEYGFSFIPKNSLYNFYASGLSISQASEFSSVLILNYQDTISLRSKEIVNAISQTFISNGVEEKTEVAELTLSFIDSQLDTINTQLSTSEKNLKNYKMKNDVVNLQGKVALATEKVAEYESQALELQTEINIMSNMQRFMSQNQNLDGLTIGTINFTDRNLAQLVTNLQTLTKTKENLLVDYTDLHPEVQKISKNIASMRRSIKQTLNNSLNQLKQRKRDLGRMVAKYNRSLRALPTQEKALAELSRPLKVNQKIYEYLLQKKAETAILKSSTISNAKILDAARENSKPVKPKRKLIVIVGLILGLIVGIALAFLREFLIYTIQNADEIEKITSLPVYGVIPLNKDKMTKNIYTEAFRNIRTNLQFLPGNEKNKVISITSSVSGEGKTTITAALAEVLARGDKKVLMLDLDMRKASLHQLFQVENNIGMSNYLTMQNSLEEVIKETDIYGLEIITTGPLPPNPAELILSEMFTKLLDTLKEKYDYIVIDTPPAGLVTDAMIIMNYSDISFAVVRAKYTRKEFVKNIDKMAKEHSQNRMGIILNGTLIGSEYGYGYGASYAYGYGNAQYYKDRG